METAVASAWSGVTAAAALRWAALNPAAGTEPTNDPFATVAGVDAPATPQPPAITAAEVLDGDPGNYSARELVAFIYGRNGPTQGLMEELEVLQCNYPMRGAAYHGFGHQMEKERNLEKAVQAFQVLEMIEPTNEEPYYDLACLYAQMDQKDKAFEYLSKSIKYGARDLAFIRRDGRLWKIRDDARFANLVGPTNYSARKP